MAVLGMAILGRYFRLISSFKKLRTPRGSLQNDSSSGLVRHRPENGDRSRRLASDHDDAALFSAAYDDDPSLLNSATEPVRCGDADRMVPL